MPVSDVPRHEIVAKAAKQRRNGDKEYHQNTVVGDHHIPEMSVGCAFLCGIGNETCVLKAHVLRALWCEKNGGVKAGVFSGRQQVF